MSEFDSNRSAATEPDLLRDRIADALQQSGYFPREAQIRVSITPEKTVRLQGVVNNYFLKQRALCSALQQAGPESIEDRIDVL